MQVEIVSEETLKKFSAQVYKRLVLVLKPPEVKQPLVREKSDPNKKAISDPDSMLLSMIEKTIKDLKDVIQESYTLIDQLIDSFFEFNKLAQANKFIDLKGLFKMLNKELQDFSDQQYFPVELIILGDFASGKTSLIT